MLQWVPVCISSNNNMRLNVTLFARVMGFQTRYTQFDAIEARAINKICRTIELKGHWVKRLRDADEMTHYGDVIMSAMASQIIGVSIVCPTVRSGADQRKYQCSASLAFVREIHRPQRASGAENVSIWWRHPVFTNVFLKYYLCISRNLLTEIFDWLYRSNWEKIHNARFKWIISFSMTSSNV